MNFGFDFILYGDLNNIYILLEVYWFKKLRRNLLKC